MLLHPNTEIERQSVECPLVLRVDPDITCAVLPEGWVRIHRDPVRYAVVEPIRSVLVFELVDVVDQLFDLGSDLKVV